MSSSEVSSHSAELKSASPANASQASKPSNRLKSLSREFFTHLIKLESDFNNKQYTVATLDELIQYYARAVEYYDKVKDEISSYFMFRIQDILATKKSLKMLLEQNSKSGSRKPSVLVTHGPIIEAPVNAETEKKLESVAEADQLKGKEEVSSGEEDDEEEEKHMTELEKKRRASKMNRKERVSISYMKNQKQRFVNFFYKMETQKVNEKQNINNLVKNFGDAAQNNDSLLRKNIDTQKDRLRKRIEERKKENFASQTLNVHSFQAGNLEYSPNNKKNSNSNSILKDLDAGEEDDSRKHEIVSLVENMDISGANNSDEDTSNSKGSSLNIKDYKHAKIEAHGAFDSRDLSTASPITPAKPFEDKGKAIRGNTEL